MTRLFGLLVAWLPLALAAAPPRVLVETELAEATVPVNGQATYTVRLLQAVDLQVPTLPPPRVRLAEVRALGDNRRLELLRDGVRYRVYERRFALLPFASGRLEIDGEVGLKSALQLPELGQRSSGVLRYPPRTLLVTPAAAAGHWLPAYAVQLRELSPPPAALASGDWWRREIVIDAEGVDGSAIPAPDWTVEPAWTQSADPPQFANRIEGERVVGTRRQVFRWRAEQAGRLGAPSVSLRWWDRRRANWQTATLRGPEIVVSGAVAAERTVAATAGPESPGRDPAVRTMLLIGLLAGFGTVLALAGWRYRWPLRAALRGRQATRALTVACRRGDPVAAQRALGDWAASAGWPETTLGAIRQRWRQLLAEAGRADDSARLDDALRQLERARYGHLPAPWDGAQLAALWHRLPQRAAAMRVSSAPSGLPPPFRSPS